MSVGVIHIVIVMIILTITIKFSLLVSLLRHFWLIHLFPCNYTCFYQPCICLVKLRAFNQTRICQFSSSYSHMRSPDVCCWFPDRSNSSHWSFEPTALPINLSIYADQCEPITIYCSLTLLVILHLCSPNSRHLQTNYCLKGVDIHGWGVYYRHCYQYCYSNGVIT